MPTSDVQIRVLTGSDAEKFSRIRLEALEQEPRAFTEAVAEHHALTLETIAQRLAPAANKFLLGAFVGGEIVGTLLFVRSERLKNRHRGNVHAMYVSKNHRSHGIARALLEEMLRKVREQPEIEQIELAVGSEQSAAKRLYESLGFRYYGREERALKMGEEYVNYDLMVLRLR